MSTEHLFAYQALREAAFVMRSILRGAEDLAERSTGQERIQLLAAIARARREVER